MTTRHESRPWLRKPGVVATVLLLAATIAACGSSGDGDTTGGAPSAAQITTDEPAPVVSDTPTPTFELSGEASYTVRLETDEGFKLRADITVYDAIRGSNTEALQAGWEQVGGTGQVPCLDADVPNDMFRATAIHTQTSAYAFGMVTIASETQGFDPPAVDWQFATGRAIPKDGEWVGSTGNPKAMGVQTSDSTECDGLDTGGFMLKPIMNSSQWGPVPVVFAFDGVFTPKHPNGDPSVVTDYPISVADFNGAKTYNEAGRHISGIPVRLMSKDAPQ